MGNICSSSQKNSTEIESGNSEGSDSENEYKFSPKNKIEEKVLKEKVENFNLGIINSTLSTKNDNGHQIAHHSNYDEIEKNNKNYSNLKQIPEHYKKIVLNIIITNKNEFKKQLNIIERLFPDLSRHVRNKGFELVMSAIHHDISQNNFITNEELENYFHEIDRHKNSYIIPVLFFTPFFEKLHCPVKIEQKDFNFLLSITSKEQNDLLLKYYTKDDNFRISDASYNLNLHSLLRSETEQILETFIALMPINLKQTYLTTAVEKIINNVILSSKELIKHCVWISTYEVLEESKESCAAIMSEVLNKHLNLNNQLKAEIPTKNIIPPFSFADEGEDLYELFSEILKSNVDNVMYEHYVKHSSRNTLGMCKVIADDIESIRKHSAAIGIKEADIFDMEGVLKYLRSDSLYPLAIFGNFEEEISIYTSHIALIFEKIIENTNLVIRYGCVSVVSSEITSLLGSIADQISVVVEGKPCHSNHTILDYKLTIERLLEICSVNIVILIDSIDKVIGAHNFDWLPKISKPNAKIILTISNGVTITENLSGSELIKRGVPKENLLPISYKSINNGRSHLNDTLNLQFLSLGIKLSRKDTGSFIENFLHTLESKIDVKFVEILLLIITTSPYGVFETDCLSIFEEQAKIERTISSIIWSKFCWLMGPILIHTERIKIKYRKFEAAVLLRYSKSINQIKQIAKQYYESQPESFFDSEKNLTSLNTEKYLKVPQYEIAMLPVSDKNVLEKYFAKHYFTDLSWISNKITSCGCFHYLYDITIAEEKFKHFSSDLVHIKILKNFLTQHMTQLNYDGSQFYTLFKIYFKNVISQNDLLNSNEFIKNWTDTLNQLKIIHFENLNNDNDNQESDESKKIKTYNEIVILNGLGHFVAAISTECDEICVWDVPNGTKIRILKNVPRPSLMCCIKNLEVAVLCKREIKVIDLEKGLYKATMKGVMNQKMPYFEVNDEDHLVCLSRNRMYVNLMNLKTGDCATSFKAGEDRFLNSLIVSGNGRILVCGDESQKPFSLLVWHLAQRRLLYDLRIPHHDLYTALSAITYEGLYVSVVAKEIKEPDPNFIVVYDLQSGTLFQKLKPTCNTVSIAISQENGCVIAGLENTEILIWDLVTGNCRHTLNGHNAPATLMKLDPSGRYLLSRDKDSRDLSLRLWELNTGKSLAVYTPPHRISCCEILENGTFIVIAMEKIKDIMIFQLKNYNETNISSENSAHKIFECKIYTLKED